MTLQTVWIATVEPSPRKATAAPQVAVFAERAAAEAFINQLLALAARPRVVTLIERGVSR